MKNILSFPSQLIPLSLQVWRPCVTSPCHSGSVLMVDVHRGHLADEFVDSLTAMFTNIVFIPAGCCCRVQPLDVCVTPVLREFLQVLSPVSLSVWISVSLRSLNLMNQS